MWKLRVEGLRPSTGRQTFCLLGLVLCASLVAACGERAAAPDVRLEKIDELEDARDSSGRLVRYLIEGDEVVRARAARALGRLQDPLAAPALARAAREDDDRAVRYEATFALGQYGLAEQLDWTGAAPPIEPIAAETVAALLTDADARVVAAATEALGKLAPPLSVVDAEARLLEQLASEDVSVRIQAAHALFRLRFAPLWRGQVEAPPALSDAAVEALGVALRDGEPRVREAAAHALSRYGEARAADALVSYLASPLASSERDAREWTPVFALRALGRSGTEVAKPATLDVLVVHLTSEDLHVRLEAVNTLAALGASERVPSTLIDDPSWLVRAGAAAAWGAGTSAESLASLQRLQGDASTGVRAAVIEALVARRGTQALDLLDETYLRHDDYRLRAAAVHALAHLPPEEAAVRLRRALRDPDVRVSVVAIAPLAELAGENRHADPTTWFAETLEKKDLAVRGAALTVLPDLLARPGVELEGLPAQLSSAYADSVGVEWIEVREQLLNAAAALPKDSRDIVPLLRRALQDPAPSVAALARDALRARGENVEVAEGEGKGAEPVTQPGSVAPPGADGEAPVLDLDNPPVVVLETNKGTMRVRTMPREAPLHVANFLHLVRQGFYDGRLWHRVAPNFVIQGGDPRGDGWGGPGYTLRDEIHPGPRYRRGTLGMPKSGKDTGGCQLFFTHIPTPHLDGNYTVFGQTVEGLDVIDQIEIGDRIVRAYVEE